MKFKLYLIIALYIVNTMSLLGMEPDEISDIPLYAQHMQQSENSIDQNSINTDYALRLSQMPALISDTESCENSDQQNQNRALFLTEDGHIVTLSGSELTLCKTLQDMATYAQDSTAFKINDLPCLPVTKETFEQLQSCLYYVVCDNEHYLKKRSRIMHFPI